MNKEQQARFTYYLEQLEKYVSQGRTHLKRLGTELIKIPGTESVRMAEDWESMCDIITDIDDEIQKLKRVCREQ
jgi:hypothetical protein